jgi:predicted AAA+ superfamily ATPase
MKNYEKSRRRKTSCVQHNSGRLTVLVTSCLLKHAVERKIEGSERRGRRCNELLDDVKETRSYWKLEESAPDRALFKTRFGSGCGTVVRHTT